MALTNLVNDSLVARVEPIFESAGAAALHQASELVGAGVPVGATVESYIVGTFVGLSVAADGWWDG